MSYIKDVDLPRHALDILPFLLIASPTPPVQSLDAYARSITWQPNKKRLTVFHEYGALSHARFARAGAPLKRAGAEFPIIIVLGCRNRKGKAAGNGNLALSWPCVLFEINQHWLKKWLVCVDQFCRSRQGNEARQIYPYLVVKKKML